MKIFPSHSISLAAELPGTTCRSMSSTESDLGRVHQRTTKVMPGSLKLGSCQRNQQRPGAPRTHSAPQTHKVSVSVLLLVSKGIVVTGKSQPCLAAKMTGEASGGCPKAGRSFLFGGSRWSSLKELARNAPFWVPNCRVKPQEMVFFPFA